MTHTWYTDGTTVWTDRGDRRYEVATVADWSEDTARYATLIACAPELLEAIEAIINGVRTKDARLSAPLLELLLDTRHKALGVVDL